MSLPDEPLPTIVAGNRVSDECIEMAKQLRREMTRAERVLWQYLRANRMLGFHVRRQQLIDAFIVDFYCHAARLVIEVDGPVHDEQRAYDEERDAILTAYGLRVRRFTNRQVLTRIGDVIAQLEADLRAPHA